MPTEWSRDLFGYEVVEGRQVVAAFEGGEVPRMPAGLLLGATDRAIRLVGRLADRFEDGRDQALIEHRIETMTAPRSFGIALGSEDLNDHDQRRHDPVLATLAGKSTLNRLEHAPSEPARFHKIGHDGAAIERRFVDLLLEAHPTPPEIILDRDATEDPLHGHQEGRFFTAMMTATAICRCMCSAASSCWRPSLRRSNIDASAAVGEVARIVGQIRARWPRVEILLRADAGFARQQLMIWCEGERTLDNWSRTQRVGGRPSICPRGRTHASS